MGEFVAVLGLALLPAAGNFFGGMLAEFFPPSRQYLNRALHAAAGIVIAIISVELMPEALGKTTGWLIALAFLCGGGFYMLIEWCIERFQAAAGDDGDVGMWMVYVAVATDLFSDGLMIGAGSAVSARLALALALGQILADVPEGFASIANFQDKGLSRCRRLLLAASFVVPVLLAAILAYFLLRGQSAALQMAALVFTAGLLTVAAVEDLISEAHASAEDSRWSVAVFIGGFVLFTLVSTVLGRP